MYSSMVTLTVHAFIGNQSAKIKIILLGTNLYLTQSQCLIYWTKETKSKDNHRKQAYWQNGYRLRKWNRWPKFESWTRLFAFIFALMILGNAYIHLFTSYSIWVYTRAKEMLCDCNLYKRTNKNDFEPNLLRLKIDLLSHPTLGGGFR